MFQRKKRFEELIPSTIDSKKIGLKVTVQDFELKPGLLKTATHIFLHLDFSAAVIDFDLFGVDVALTSGIQLKYRKQKFGEPIKKTDDLGQFGELFVFPSDKTSGAVDRHIYAIWKLWEFTRNFEGLRIDEDRNIEIQVLDDLSGSANADFFIVIAGWRI